MASVWPSLTTGKVWLERALPSQCQRCDMFWSMSSCRGILSNRLPAGRLRKMLCPMPRRWKFVRLSHAFANSHLAWCERGRQHRQRLHPSSSGPCCGERQLAQKNHKRIRFDNPLFGGRRADHRSLYILVRAACVETDEELMRMCQPAALARPPFPEHKTTTMAFCGKMRLSTWVRPACESG